MSNIFNTRFEISIRLLLLLDAVGVKISSTRASLLDFVATYGKDFGISEINLHGNSSYLFSEYSSRKTAMDTAFKILVLEEYACPLYSKRGFSYKISNKGKQFCHQLNDDYADIYRQNIQCARKMFGKYSDRALIQYINRYAIARLKGDSYEFLDRKNFSVRR